MGKDLQEWVATYHKKGFSYKQLEEKAIKSGIEIFDIVQAINVHKVSQSGKLFPIPKAAEVIILSTMVLFLISITALFTYTFL